ncbi:MAG: hypothetical protein FWB96_09965 [Defluviitaleaceae bacterium]|nr:hypothetical protein [Defluviitaleaceae bacterium]MCL2263196.1 hypothetical protein [Defluviitaleaceae bacterium]
MANSNEKMRVLDLLESGKINATEASELLSVLNVPRLMNKETRENMEEKLQQFAQDCNKFAKDVSCKLQVAYKNAEPKLKKAGKSALEKAADALDNLACSINETLENSKDEDDDDDTPVEN